MRSQLYFVTSIFCSALAVSAQSSCDQSNKTVDLLPDTIDQLQLALFLENLEVDFFRSAIANLSDADTQRGSQFNQSISATLEQEISHQSVISDILAAAGHTPISPCQYTFPSTNTSEFLSVGRSLSQIGVGASISLAGSISASDADLVAGIASIATTEARHSAFFEISNGKIPNPTAFDAPLPGVWAFNLALSSVVPGSCPSLPPLPILPTLAVTLDPTGDNTTVDFSWDSTERSLTFQGNRTLFLGWIDEMGAPIYTALNQTGPGTGRGKVPEGLGNSVTLMVGLTSQISLPTLGSLAQSTLAGPAVLVR